MGALPPHRNLYRSHIASDDRPCNLLHNLYNRTQIELLAALHVHLEVVEIAAIGQVAWAIPLYLIESSQPPSIDVVHQFPRQGEHAYADRLDRCRQDIGEKSLLLLAPGVRIE